MSTLLVDAASYYMKRYGHPMVLVFDQVDNIAKQDPDFLWKLQNFAKLCADNGALKIVFISSEDFTLNQMRREIIIIFNVPFLYS